MHPNNAVSAISCTNVEMFDRMSLFETRQLLFSIQSARKSSATINSAQQQPSTRSWFLFFSTLPPLSFPPVGRIVRARIAFIWIKRHMLVWPLSTAIPKSKHNIFRSTRISVIGWPDNSLRQNNNYSGWKRVYRCGNSRYPANNRDKKNRDNEWQ